VLVTEQTRPPSLPGLPERDLVSISGRSLTLMNPAYMTRQVHGLGASERGVFVQITSLRPLRPENAADRGRPRHCGLSSAERRKRCRSRFARVRITCG